MILEAHKNIMKQLGMQIIQSRPKAAFFIEPGAGTALISLTI